MIKLLCKVVNFLAIWGFIILLCKINYTTVKEVEYLYLESSSMNKFVKVTTSSEDPAMDFYIISEMARVTEQGQVPAYMPIYHNKASFQAIQLKSVIAMEQEGDPVINVGN